MASNREPRLNYKADLTRLEDQIVEATFADHRERIQLLAANLNCLYCMMLTREGAQGNIFPIRSPRRAVRFWVSTHALSTFQLGSTTLDHLLRGRYTEGACLLRSLIEACAYCEYFALVPDVAKATSAKVENWPSRRVVFKKLSEQGCWPVGGPRRAFERYNVAAHAQVGAVLEHSAEVKGEPAESRIWLRKFNGESFQRLARDMVLPLQGVQELYRREFLAEQTSGPWVPYWKLGHDREKLARNFAKLRFGESRENAV